LKPDRTSLEKNASLSGLLLIASVFLFATGCTRSLLPNNNYFIPPTLAGASNPIILETYTPLPATATPECDNNLVFLRDITVPDGSHYSPGAPIEKSWELRNDGTCAWIHGYYVQLRDGDMPMGAAPKQALPVAQPGETITLTIQFTAPNQPGHYRSLWKAHALGDDPFGVGFFIDIEVP
jgi:hypothetical protein